MVGRVAVEPLGPPLPAGAREFRHQWPAIYFEAAFRGDRIVLKFDDAGNEYRLMIDDLPPITLADPGKAEVRIGGLGNGPHRLRLEKINETQDSAGAFQGFYVPAESRAPPPPPRARQIEFIGDSSMSGYGNRSPSRQCTPDEVRRRTDTQQAYPSLVARHFDADYQVNASSGRGLIRNYGGLAPELAVPKLYPYILYDRRQPWSDPAWQPQIIVIKLNADFVSPLNPGEPWKTMSELGDAYAAAYGDFIAGLHRRTPGASFLIWWFDESRIGNLEQALMVGRWRLAIAERAKAEGVGTLEYLPMKDLGYELTACDSHYSLADHRKTADWLIGWLDARPGLWRR